MKQALLEAFSRTIFAAVLALLAFGVRIPDIVGKVTEERLWDAVGEGWIAIAAFALSFCLVASLWRSHERVLAGTEHVEKKILPVHVLFLFFVSALLFSTRLINEFGAMQVTMLLHATFLACASLALSWLAITTHKNDSNLSLDTIMVFCWALIILLVSTNNPAVALMLGIFGGIIRLCEWDAWAIRKTLPYIKMNTNAMHK